MPSKYPPPPSPSLVATLYQCHVSCASVFPCRISCDTILEICGKTQPRYMHGPCSLVHLVQPYTTSLEPHNHLLRVCVRFVRPYLQEDRDNTTNYIHIPFGGASSLNDTMPCMGSILGETDITWSNLSPPSDMSNVQLLQNLLMKTM